jgi:hypothetical protein
MRRSRWVVVVVRGLGRCLVMWGLFGLVALSVA